MPRLVILDDWHQLALDSADWGSLDGFDVVALTEHVDDEDELVERLVDAEVVVVMRERTSLPGRLLRRLPALRLIVTTGSYNLVVDVAAARELGILVCGTKGPTNATPELTWALILAAARNIPREDAGVRAGRPTGLLGADLKDSTLGLLGLGRVGAEVARVGLAFGMEVIAWSEHLDDQRADEVGVRRVTKQQLFAQSDVVSVHVVLSDRTRHLVGDAELRAMKPTAYLVNTARGPVVDTDALVRVLQEGRIAGAALDVFDQEPLAPDHPLCALPNTVLTPHVGFVTRRYFEVSYQQALADVQAYLAGTPLRVVPASNYYAEAPA